jgi:hypothetical protein
MLKASCLIIRTEPDAPLFACPFPKVSVVLVPDRSEFDRLVWDLLRVEIEVP